jgi:predicted Zn-dependent protease
LIARGQTEEAGPLIAAVLAKTPRHPEALGAKGRLLIALGKPDQAIEPLTAATSGSEADPWIELARGQILAGRPDKATEAAAQALKRSGGHPWALAVAAHAAALQGRKSEALTLLSRALAAPPRRHEAWLALARAYDAVDRPVEAERCRREARIGGGPR